ncbi:unnamed protein product [Pleuronectes platessa]|uniref:Uncharacterized protein n=1 Tax=Pleuronectes platessa TaxID=8262 RepID=A0A9N7Z1A4_PLEPL|nr:unnamed protein product [Pleuronectes platessa]
MFLKPGCKRGTLCDLLRPIRGDPRHRRVDMSAGCRPRRRRRKKKKLDVWPLTRIRQSPVGAVGGGKRLPQPRPLILGLLTLYEAPAGDTFRLPPVSKLLEF